MSAGSGTGSAQQEKESSMSFSIILGALRVVWLQGLSATLAAWLTPLRRLGLGVAGAGVIAMAAYAFWPHGGSAIERAVLDALGQRQAITNINIDEEKRDNAWLEEWEKNMSAGRDAAARAAGAAADRVLWRADDPWLQSKRAAKSR
jgi:hypothetical protein